LRLITEWQYRTFCVELSQKGYRRSERDGIPREASQIFAKVFDALRSEGVSRGVISRELAITLAELDSLLVGLVITSVPNNNTGKTGGGESTPKEKTKLRVV